MNFTAAQIEDIVRVVLQRLRSESAAPSSKVPGPPAQPANKTAAKTASANSVELHLTERVITLETLKGRLGGIQIVAVHPKAVVTPASRDELNQRNIQMVRQLPGNGSQSVRSAPLLLVATNEQLQALGNRVCSQQAQRLASNDVNATLLAVKSHLAQGGSGAVWCSAIPFAAISAMRGQADLRAIQLADQRDLQRAMEQAQPNVIVIDKQSWTEAAIANLVRNWFRSTR